LFPTTKGIAETVENPSKEKIIPDAFDKNVKDNIIRRVKEVV
jgi:hypothetical protein